MCHKFLTNVLDGTNLVLENTLQQSVWRHVLKFIIVTKILSILFISTTIIIIIIGSINNIIVPTIIINNNNNNTLFL